QPTPPRAREWRSERRQPFQRSYNAPTPFPTGRCAIQDTDGFMASSSAARNAEAIVIWNPGAGSTAQADDLRRALTAQAGVELIETRTRDEAIARVQAACRD